MTSDHTSGRDPRQDSATGIAQPGSGLSRKQVLLILGAGATGATGAVSAGCGSERPQVDERGRTDVELLNNALKLEHTSVALYGSEPGGSGSRLRDLANDFAGQAEERVEVLSGLVEEFGGVPLEPGAGEAYVEEFDPTEVADEAGFVRLAIELENVAVAGYTDKVAELASPELRRLFYDLAGNSAAHISVLLGAAGQVQVPDPLVTGQPA